VNASRAIVYRALLDARAVATRMVPTDGATDVLAVHDLLPPGLSTADNEVGWWEALAKLAALVEAR
jgi:hypothetical protein